MSRVLNVGGTLGKVVATASVVPSVVNAISTFSNSVKNDEDKIDVNMIGPSLGQGIESLITFMDMNAQLVEIDESRRIARVDVPGRVGDYLQDMGSKSVTYRIEGKFYAMDPSSGRLQSPFSPIFQAGLKNVAVGNTQVLRTLMRTGVPVPFMSQYEVSEVIIKNFKIIDRGGNPEVVKYILDLIEYRRLPTFIKLAGLAIRGALG